MNTFLRVLSNVYGNRYILSFIFVLLLNFSCFSQNTFPSSGNAGIGTINPGARLDIYEPSDSKPSGTVATPASMLKLSRYGTPSWSYAEAAEFRITHGGPTYWGSRLDLYINGASNQNNIPDQHVMTWQYNGAVGIGTVNPQAKLQVSGDLTIGGDGTANLDPASRNLAGLANSGRLLVGWNRNSGRGETDFIQNQGGGDTGGFAFFNISNGGTESQLMYIRGNGQVSIGNVNPYAYKLAVGGSMIAESVRIKNVADWPDYVFDPRHRLQSPDELNAFISQYHHLPDVPLAAEMAENGMDLVEINKTLVKKIEELTLYMIEQHEEIKKIKKEIAALKK